MTAQARYKYETGREALYLYQPESYGPQVLRRTSGFIDWLEKIVDQLDVEKDKD